MRCIPLHRGPFRVRRIVRELTAKGVRVQFVKEELTFTRDDRDLGISRETVYQYLRRDS